MDQVPPPPVPAPPPTPTPGQGPYPQNTSGLPPLGRMLWYGGINIVSYELRNAPLFVPTYDNGASVQMRDFFGMDLFYGVPDHVVYDSRMSSASQTTGSTMEYESDFSLQFGFDISAEESVDEVESIEGDTSFSYKGNLFSDTSRAYEMCYYVCKTGSFKVPAGPALLDPDFSATANAMLGVPANDPSWIAFFEQYGTHWIESCDIGGVFMMQSSVDKSTFSTTTETEFRASFKASFDDLISSGSLSASFYINTSSFYKQYAETMSVESTSRGGTPGSTEKDFFNSCIYQPTLLTIESPGVCGRPVLQPISSLFAGTDLATAIQEALDFYTGIAATAIFQEPVNLCVNALQEAPSDGILILSSVTTGDQIAISDFTTDVMCSGICVDYTRTIWIPVCAGDRFIASSNFGPSDPQAPTLMLLPLDNGTSGKTSAFGPTQRPDLSWVADPNTAGAFQATFTPEGDGFLSLQYASAPCTTMDGPTIGITQTPPGASNEYFYAIAEDPKGDEYISIVVPVFGGQPVTVSSSAIAQPGEIGSQFVPFVGIALTGLTGLRLNVAAQLNEDSLVLVNLLGTSAGNASFILNQAPTISTATQEGLTAYTTVAMQVGYSQGGLSCAAAEEWLYPHSIPHNVVGYISAFGLKQTTIGNGLQAPRRRRRPRAFRRPRIDFSMALPRRR